MNERIIWYGMVVFCLIYYAIYNLTGELGWWLAVAILFTAFAYFMLRGAGGMGS